MNTEQEIEAALKVLTPIVEILGGTLTTKSTLDMNGLTAKQIIITYDVKNKYDDYV